MDTGFIRELKEHRESAFRRLIEEFQDHVYNTCLGFLKNRSDAEDVAQEVFTEIYRSVGKFREDSKLSTWIYRITVTKSLELLRKKKQQKRWAYFQSMLGVETDLSNISPPDEMHPGVLLENKERAAILMEKIERLPENQRIAFVLHNIECLPYSEIAEIMEVSLPAVESLIFRAKKNLRKMLEVYYTNNR